MSFDPSTFKPARFLWEFENGVATITLNRPERKNSLTFESYEELRSTFYALDHNYKVKAVVLRGAGGNFCSGGDVHEIIGPLVKMSSQGLLRFTRMTSDLVRAMRHCPQPIIAAVEGVCAGAGAIMAMASDIRFGQPGCRTAFLFSRVGLSGADMGACAILPQNHRTWPSCRAFVHRPRDGERGGACLGILQPPGRGCDGRSFCPCRPARRGTLDRPLHYEAPARRGVGHGDRPGPGIGGASAGAVHGNEGFPPRLRSIRK